MTEETPEALVKFLGTWPDRVLEEDWRSALGGPCGDEVVKTYVHLRRRAGGWSPRKMGPNNHKAINPAALAALVNGPAFRSPNRATCEVCHGRFTARRTTARFCSPRCQVAASRARRGRDQPFCLGKRRKRPGQKGCESPSQGKVDQSPTSPSGGGFSQTSSTVVEGVR